MIRSLSLADVPEVAALLRETQDYHAENNPRRYARIEGQNRLCEIVKSQLSCPDAISICAERNGRIVGYVLAALSEISTDGVLVPQRYVMLNEIAVRADCRRQGIANDLMVELKNRSKSGGATMLRAAHGVFNDASSRLLENHGLRAVSVTREMYFE